MWWCRRHSVGTKVELWPSCQQTIASRAQGCCYCSLALLRRSLLGHSLGAVHVIVLIDACRATHAKCGVLHLCCIRALIARTTCTGYRQCREVQYWFKVLHAA